MAVFLALGGIIFQGFEAPESIRTGGEHALVVHKLPGGARVVDAMGPDDADISWSGRFRGNQAEARARRLDGLRRAGGPLTLTWSGYRHRVIVRSFEANFQQPFEIPYSISCLVLADEGSPLLTGIPGLDELIGDDLGKLLSLDGLVNYESLTGAIGTVQSAIGAVNAIRNAPGGSIANILGSIGMARELTLGVVTQAEETLAAAGAFTPGDVPSLLASGLATQAEQFGKLGNLVQMGSTLGRMAKNMAAAGE